MVKGPFPSYSLALALIFALPLWGCGGGESCRTPSDCSAGFRCEGATSGGSGECVSCPAEVPYDGEDNDCNPGTKDRDLDGDGDNATDATKSPGTDCDDNDPAVSGRMPEVCGDRKDNNCNGTTDEAPCGDAAPPVVTIRSPSDGAAISGITVVEVEVQDDTGVAKVDLYAGGVLRTTLTDAPYRFSLDTAGMPDGPTPIRALATDLANRTGEAMITVAVDNRSPPQVTVNAPLSVQAYGGILQIQLDAIDAAGVREVEISLDGNRLTQLAAGPYVHALDTRSLAEGPHTLSVRAMDVAGNEGTTNRTFLVDNTRPELSFNPGDGANVSRTVTFTVEALDASGIASITGGASSSSVSPLRLTIDFETMPSGQVIVSATAVDRAIVDGAAGNTRTASITVNSENLGPAFNLTSPAPTEYYGGQATIAGVAIDPLGVDFVEVRLDGNVLQTGANATVNVNVDTRSMTDGPHPLVVETRDSLGLTATYNHTLWVDNTGPVIGSAPADGATVAGRFTLSLLATDPAGLLDLVANGQTSTTSPLRLDLDFDLTPDGNYSVAVTARDGAIIDGQRGLGNSRTETIDLIIDNPGPALTFLRPNPLLGYGGTVTIEVDAVDPNGVQQVVLRRGAQTLATLTSPPFTTVLDTAALADGNVDLSAVGTDGLGNVSTVSHPLRVDHTGPTITFTAPAPGATVQATIPVTGDAADPSGIREVTLGTSRSTLSTFNFNYNTVALPNGNATITVEAWDQTVIDDQPGLGNRGTGAVTVNVQNPQNTPPSVVITSPTQGDGVYRSFTFSADVTSPVGVTEVRFFLEGTQIARDTTAPYSTTVDVSDRVGPILLEVTGFGANGASATASINVEVVAPPVLQAGRVVPLPSSGLASYDVVDTNGDGLLDLVTAGSPVSVRLGLPNFAFGPPTALNASGTIVAFGDVEADGDYDVVSVTASSFDLYVRGANFAGRVQTNIGSIQPRCLALGDLDGDGDLDAVVGRGQAGADFVVLHRNNAGAYTVVGTRGGIGAVEDIAIADVDLDGNQDVVVGRSAMGVNVVTVFRNADGLGTFTGAGLDTQLNGPGEMLEVADFNGDAYPDLAVGVVRADPGTNPGGLILIGNPATPGQYPAATNTQMPVPGLLDVATGDIDDDGDVDLFWASSPDNGGRFFINSGTGTFTEQRRYTVAKSPAVPRLADADDDGRLDLLLASSGSDALVIAPGRPQGLFLAAPILSLPRAPRTIAAAELAGGGLIDLAVGVAGANPIAPAVQVFRNDGNEAITPTATLNVAREITSIAVGNIDGTSGLDIAVGSDTSLPGTQPSCATLTCPAGTLCGAGQLCETITAQVLLANGAGYDVRSLTQIPRPRAVAIGDVMSGGFEELITTFDLTSSAGSRVYGNGTTPLYVSTTQLGASALLVGDFAAPAGLLDYVVANTVTNNVTLQRQLAGGFATEQSYNVFDNVSGLAAGFLGGDNQLDLLMSANGGVIAMPGDPVFTFGAPISFTANTPNTIAASDLNGDGLTDAITYNSQAEFLSVLLARPQGGFFSPETWSIPEGATDLIAADFDGDTTVDLLVSSTTGQPGLTIYYSR